MKFIKAVGTFLFIWIIASLLAVIVELSTYYLGIPWASELNGLAIIIIMILLYWLRHREEKKVTQ